MRLIDADRFLKMMSHWKPYMDMDNVREAIKKMPTIDAVPVVRCKDCISHGNCLTEDTFRIARIENPYCCGGKRKEADNEVLES